MEETEAALKAAIEADPLDLVARGAYADWLEENGREHEIKRWYWTTQAGEIIETKDLDDRHLWNILRYVALKVYHERRVSRMTMIISELGIPTTSTAGTVSDRLVTRATGVILEAERRRFPWRERIPTWIREESSSNHRQRRRYFEPV